MTNAVFANALGPEGPPAGVVEDPYKGKWSTLSNTTLGMLMATIDASIVLISLPDIFRGIKLNALTAGNTSYFLWLLMGYMLVTAVLVVSFGRLGDIFGRVRMYNMGFAIFTFFSVMLSITWMHGRAAALFMIIMRIFQGVGGAFIMANSTAILTDAFPPSQRGLALGTNMVAAIAGSFIGLVLGGLLGPIDWRLVFLVSVPVGVGGTIWAYINLKDKGIRTPARIDWVGNATFAIGLVSVLVGIVYGIEPYGGHTMGWTNPLVLAALAGGVAILCLFVWIETKVAAPMFNISLFRIRSFAAGNVAGLMSALGRGGLMFILIIWLQGIWLPEHGYSFATTPLWAGIFMLPLTAGFLVAGPVSGRLSDRFGARLFSTGGMLLAALSFGLLELLPIDFSYVWFALLLLLNGLAMGLFAAPNRAAIMNSLPPNQRGQGSGMSTVGMNASMVLSIGIFFTLIIVGLASSLPSTLYNGLVAHGVPSAAAHQVAGLPPTTSVFSAFLGYNPISELLGPSGVLTHLTHAQSAFLTSRHFFPSLIAGPFGKGLHEAFDFAVIAVLIAAAASAMIGKQYFYKAPADAPASGSLGDSLAAEASMVAGELVAVGASPVGEEAAVGPRHAGAALVGAGEARGPGLEALSGASGVVTNGQASNGQASNGSPGNGSASNGSPGNGQASNGSPGNGSADPATVGNGVEAPGHNPGLATAEVVAGHITPASLALDTTTAISGVVRGGAGGASLADMALSLLDSEGKVIRTGFSAPDGSFRFAGLAEGRYTVVAGGYQPLARTVATAAGDTVDVELSFGGRRP